MRVMFECKERVVRQKSEVLSVSYSPLPTRIGSRFSSGRLHVLTRPVGEARESAWDEGVGRGDVLLVLGAKVRVLRPVLEHLADLMGARVEAVVDRRGHLHYLKLMPLRVQRPDKVIEGVVAAPHGQVAPVAYLIPSRTPRHHGP